ncbi:carboxylesterase family protein [Rhizobium sp.]|jgi:para-nitrobenzyl esterase|uniref:carboxylesterase/lipase family protein n=1 Tax=Rhizobium sp. TaxID=391 RepID=UPI000E96F268|nr:carboxylesterase [Rhizobium sp.]
MSKQAVIDTPFGQVRGTIVDGVASFKRIPYSEPRTGADRFGKPTKPPLWDGVRDATQVGPVAPQLPSRLDAVMGAYDVAQDEDSLHVDIWTPHAPDASAPVLVFIHGGAFMTGGGSLPCYDGHDLAKNTGLVVVTITYRLGILGFMPIPEFDAVNLGHHDQIAALRWVRQAISAFGGDPQRVTVAGQSAGAYSIAVMLGTEVGKELFNQAILMSTPLGLKLKTAQASVGVRSALLRELGFEADQLDKLRETPIEDMLQALLRMRNAPTAKVGDVTPPFMPVIDGDLIPRDPIELIRDGSAAWCKTIIGVTREEHASFSIGASPLNDLNEESLLAVFEQQFGDDGKSVLEEYRAKRVPATPRTIIGDMRSDLDFVKDSFEFAESQFKHGQTHSYAYQFDWQSPLPGLGAGHCLDLPFLFGNLAVWGKVPMVYGADNQEVSDLTKVFQGGLSAFVLTGNPNGNALPHWPAYQNTRGVLHFDKHVSAMGHID